LELARAEQLARQKMQEHGLFARGWSFEWCQDKTTFGWCLNSQKVIKLSQPLVLLNGEEEVLDTILHEIAHALAPAKEHHGRVWQAIARSIGARPNRCYDLKSTVLPQLRFDGVCDACGEKFQMAKFPARGPRSCRCQNHLPVNLRKFITWTDTKTGLKGHYWTGEFGYSYSSKRRRNIFYDERKPVLKVYAS
jgi:predicted SprT family Zn-dependent metalloprotease